MSTDLSPDLYRALITQPDAGRPLVFAFHGTGGDERQFFDLAQKLVPGGGVVSPRGDVSERGAARFFRRKAEGLYDMEDLALRRDRMIDFIEAQRARAPESPAYGFGYSNGANILAAVFMARPDLFERVALLHPLVTWAAEADPKLVGRKVLITAGTRDPITPWPQSAALIEWFTKAGAEVTTEVHPGGHELRPPEVSALAQHFAD